MNKVSLPRSLKKKTLVSFKLLKNIQGKYFIYCFNAVLRRLVIEYFNDSFMRNQKPLAEV